MTRRSLFTTIATSFAWKKVAPAVLEYAPPAAPAHIHVDWDGQVVRIKDETVAGSMYWHGQPPYLVMPLDLPWKK